MKIVVAHPGQQHSYELASALKASECLYKYITTYYSKKKNNKFWTKIPIIGDLFLRANKRNNPDLDEVDVLTYNTFLFYIVSFLLRFDKSKKIYRLASGFLANCFGKKVAEFAMKNQVDAVVMYDTASDACFQILKKEAPHIIRIQDVSAINRIYIKDIYEADMKRSPQYADILKKERGFVFQKKNLDIWQREIDTTQYFIVPSKIVKKSLEYSGAYGNKIYKCSYGANFVPVKSKKYFFENNKLNIIYVGNISQMKGVFYLLDAFMELPREKFSLTVVGMYDERNERLRQYKSRVNFVGYVQHEEVKKYLEHSDVFAFPSLGDSFGLVVLEAMAYGLPIICSDHAGAADAIKNGENGFVIPAGSKEEIRNKLLYCYENRDFVKKASEASLQQLKEYTWDNYRKNIKEIFNAIYCQSQGINGDYDG